MQNEQIIQESAKGLIDWFTQTASASEDFIIEQAPLYAQEVVAWVFWSSAIEASVLFIGVILLLAFALYSAMRVRRDPTSEWGAGVVMGLLGGSFLFIGCAFNVASAIKAHVAPRVVILEHVRDLVN